MTNVKNHAPHRFNSFPVHWFSTVAALFCLLIIVSGCQVTAPAQPAAATSTAVPPPTATLPPTAAPTPTITPTPTEPPCIETKGRLVNVDIPTEHLNRPVNTNIYLPPCYDPDSPSGYPVLYMFHGQAATNDQWIRLGLTNAADDLISRRVIQPLIIVMPFEVTWTPGPDESTFDEAVLQDVLPYVEREYAACLERTCRAVGGLSRGGNWAVYLGFAHPELFGAIGAHSTPLFYGEIGRITRTAAGVASPADLPHIYADMGDRDAQKDKVLEFIAALEEAGIPFDFNQFEGRHEESYWSAHVVDYLEWYSANLNPPGAE